MRANQALLTRKPRPPKGEKKRYQDSEQHRRLHPLPQHTPSLLGSHEFPVLSKSTQAQHPEQGLNSPQHTGSHYHAPYGSQYHSPGDFRQGSQHYSLYGSQQGSPYGSQQGLPSASQKLVRQPVQHAPQAGSPPVASPRSSVLTLELAASCQTFVPQQTVPLAPTAPYCNPSPPGELYEKDSDGWLEMPRVYVSSELDAPKAACFIGYADFIFANSVWTLPLWNQQMSLHVLRRRVDLRWLRGTTTTSLFIEVPENMASSVLVGVLHWARYDSQRGASEHVTAVSLVGHEFKLVPGLTGTKLLVTMVWPPDSSVAADLDARPTEASLCAAVLAIVRKFLRAPTLRFEQVSMASSPFIPSALGDLQVNWYPLSEVVKQKGYQRWWVEWGPRALPLEHISAASHLLKSVSQEAFLFARGRLIRDGFTERNTDRVLRLGAVSGKILVAAHVLYDMLIEILECMHEFSLKPVPQSEADRHPYFFMQHAEAIWFKDRMYKQNFRAWSLHIQLAADTPEDVLQAAVHQVQHLTKVLNLWSQTMSSAPELGTLRLPSCLVEAPLHPECPQPGETLQRWISSARRLDDGVSVRGVPLILSWVDGTEALPKTWSCLQSIVSVPNQHGLALLAAALHRLPRLVPGSVYLCWLHRLAPGKYGFGFTYTSESTTRDIKGLGRSLVQFAGLRWLTGYQEDGIVPTTNVVVLCEQMASVIRMLEDGIFEKDGTMLPVAPLWRTTESPSLGAWMPLPLPEMFDDLSDSAEDPCLSSPQLPSMPEPSVPEPEATMETPADGLQLPCMLPPVEAACVGAAALAELPRRRAKIPMDLSSLLVPRQYSARPLFTPASTAWRFTYQADEDWPMASLRIRVPGPACTQYRAYFLAVTEALPADYFAEGGGLTVAREGVVPCKQPLVLRVEVLGARSKGKVVAHMIALLERIVSHGMPVETIALESLVDPGKPVLAVRASRDMTMRQVAELRRIEPQSLKFHVR